jgi:hypothetical protein
MVTTPALAALAAFGDPRALPAIQRYIDHATDSRGVRVAREAAAAIRRGQTRDQETRRLRTDVDEMREDGRKLRERLAALEARTEASANGRTNGRVRARPTANGAGNSQPARRSRTRHSAGAPAD